MDIISQKLQAAPVELLVYVAMALMFVGLGFKVAAAPFHIWTPDVYEGAPAPIVGFMSTAPKAAAFAVLLRVVFTINAPGRFWLIWMAAALSMTLGNVCALVQTNIKRLLAYSSIAHAGYVLVAFAMTASDNSVAGISAAMFYTAAYAAMNVGAFAVVSHFANAGERYVTLEDYEGLGRTSPLLAATLTIFLLSLIGIPMTGGFFAKFYVFSAAVKANLIWLTLIGVVNSAIGAYYYLRVIVVMYMRESRRPVPVSPVPFGLGLALALSIAATLYLGILPNRVLQFAQQSAQELLPQPPMPISANTAQTRPPAAIPQNGSPQWRVPKHAFDKKLRRRASCVHEVKAQSFTLKGTARPGGEQMSKLIQRLWSEDAGQDIAEYAVMLAVILVLVVGTVRLIGSNANNAFSSVASSLQ